MRDDFEQWVHARSRALARTAYLLVGDVHLAEDLVQETLGRVAQQWDRVHRKGSPDAYAHQVMNNLAIDGWRRRSRRPHEVAAELDPGVAQADGSVERVVLRDALLRLTPKQRAMSTPELRDKLDDVARGPAMQVRVDAQAAWTDGARRRVRRRLAVGAASASAVAAVVAGAPLAQDMAGVPSGAEESRVRADHYPQRIDHDYVESTMPSVTGPLAGVVNRSNEDWFGSWGVSPSGRIWRIADVYGTSVSISPTGTHLAYLRGEDAREALLVITDQTTGNEVVFSDVGVGAGAPPRDRPAPRYFHSDQMPLFWNPAGTAVLGQLGTVVGRHDRVAAGVFALDGTVTHIPNSPELPSGSHPIGWFTDSTVGFVTEDGRKARVSAVDVATGQVSRSFGLDVRAAVLSQWAASLSPDGTTIMTLDNMGGPDHEPIRLHYARGDNAGTVRTTRREPENYDTPCQPTWTTRDAYVPLYQTDESDAVLYRVNGGTPIVADPRLHVTCSVWAASALEGGADPSIGGRLFGTQDTWLSWHWRELTSGVLAGLALTTVGFALRRRRRR